MSDIEYVTVPREPTREMILAATEFCERADRRDYVLPNGLWAAMLAAAPVAGWQPISSSPKDGSRFLAWDGRDRVEICYWDDWQDPDGDSVVEWNLRLDGNSCPKRATHWMPLPEPPK